MISVECILLERKYWGGGRDKLALSSHFCIASIFKAHIAVLKENFSKHMFLDLHSNPGIYA